METKRSENDIVFSGQKLARDIKGSTNSWIQKTQETGKRQIALIEAIIIGVGTLIWGFGDLIWLTANNPKQTFTTLYIKSKF